MNLISALIAGIRGAENGSATLYKRGTTNPATWYGSFEAAAPNSSGDAIALDANGSVEAYVDELVDILVKDVDGNTVRSFTEGDSSPPVEVRSPSFTGADYASAALAAGNPTTLQAVLDLWLTKNGAIDWQVLFNGLPTTIQSVLSMLNGKLFYNVKDDAFGATGAGTNDDTAAIQLAINTASSAGGGVIVFPEGTYKVNTTLSVPTGIILIGLGGPIVGFLHTVTLTMDHGSNTLLDFTGTSQIPQLVANLHLKASQTHTGKMINGTDDSSVELVNVIVGDAGNTEGDLVTVNTLVAKQSYFRCAGAAGRACVERTAGNFQIHDCKFRAGVGAYSPTNGMVVSRVLDMSNCSFDMSSMTSGTARGIYTGTVGSAVNLHVVHCTIGAPTGGTVQLFNFSVASITHLTKVFEDYNVAEGASALYAVNATPFTGDATAAANPGTESWNFHLGSRERRLVKITHNATPYDLNTLEYGIFVLERTDAVAQTLTANAAVPNGKLTIMTHNNTGGAGATITKGAGFYPGEAFSIGTTQLWDVRTYRGADMLGNMRWLTDAGARNNI